MCAGLPSSSANRPRRRLWLGLGFGTGLLGFFALVYRTTLATFALEMALEKAGAREVDLQVERLDFTQLELGPGRFLHSQVPVSFRRLGCRREAWYSPDFGAVSLEGLSLTLGLPGGGAKDAGAVPTQLQLPTQVPPLRSLSIEGQLRLGATPEGPGLTIGLKAQQEGSGLWTSRTQLLAPGLELVLTTRSDFGQSTHSYQVEKGVLELGPWQHFFTQLLGAGFEDFVLQGRLELESSGSLEGTQAQTRGRLRLFSASLQSESKKLKLEGLSADLQLQDLEKILSAPGQWVRLERLSAGAFVAENLTAEFQLLGEGRLGLTSLGLQALGGRLEAEPFVFTPKDGAVDLTLVASNLRMEQVLALVPEAPARARGAVSGRLPLQWDKNGLRFGRGSLGLTPDTKDAELEFGARGLLTGGLDPKNPSYAVLDKVENGLLRLRLKELRLDLHPEGLQAERSAVLRLSGEPLDPGVRAPIELDLNFHGPIEQLLNLGMDSRVQFGGNGP